jgi:hypothetical protein
MRKISLLIILLALGSNLFAQSLKDTVWKSVYYRENGGYYIASFGSKYATLIEQYKGEEYSGVYTYEQDGDIVILYVLGLPMKSGRIIHDKAKGDILIIEGVYYYKQ